MLDVEDLAARDPAGLDQVAEMVRVQVMKALDGDTRAFLAVVGRLQGTGAAGEDRSRFGGLKVMELLVERDDGGPQVPGDPPAGSPGPPEPAG